MAGQDIAELEVEEIPSEVKEFIIDFYHALFDQHQSPDHTIRIRQYYFDKWNTLTEEYFKNTEWPADSAISTLVEENEVFLLCYNELYYRHIHTHGRPHLHHRFDSYTNYMALFTTLLENTPATKDLKLPLEWLSDMFDEFLYQFEDFCGYKQQMEKLSEEEIELLENHPEVWDVPEVIQILAAFADVYTREEQETEAVTSQNLTYSPLIVQLGYLATLGLSRLQVLIADYRLALTTLMPIDLDDRRALYTRLNSTHISLFYYTGFAYLMLRRYSDAVSLFSTILLVHRGRNRGLCFGDAQAGRKYEKIRALCAVALSLSPGMEVEEQVRKLIIDKLGDSAGGLLQRDKQVFSELFLKNCPRFITPARPNYKDIRNKERETTNAQLQGLLREVDMQSKLPEMRSYLKLYSSISVPKLSNLCGISEEILLEHLVAMKYKANQQVRGAEDDAGAHESKTFQHLAGNLESVGDLHFFIEGSRVHVDEKARKQKFADFFLANALRLNQSLDELRNTNRRKRRTGTFKAKRNN